MAKAKDKITEPLPKQEAAPVPLNRMVQPGMVRVRALRPLFVGDKPKLPGDEFHIDSAEVATLVNRQLIDPIG